MNAEFYSIKSKLYLGLFSVKTLLEPSLAFAVQGVLLQQPKSSHCDTVRKAVASNTYFSDRNT